MRAGQLINKNIPQLRLQDSTRKALQLMSDFRVSHLPVLSEKKFLGLVSEDDLLDADDEHPTVEHLQETFLKKAVQEDAHFLNAVSNSIQADTTVVAVVNKDEDLVGVITGADMLRNLGNFTGAGSVGGIIVLEMERPHFAMSDISRIAESSDCTIMHLNTETDPAGGMLTVTLHINRRDISALTAAFERYEYTVVFSSDNDTALNTAGSNYQNLMNYLGI